MKSRLPKFLNKRRICIICEGDEEYEYLERLKILDVWNQQYEILLDNADGNGNIPARYQDRFQNGTHDIVLVFCDTDRKPYEQYIDIKRKINDIHGMESAAEQVVIFGNPCTMQIILEHWKEIKLNSQAKKVNAVIIQELTGIKKYKGKAEQRRELFSGITKENYLDMKERIERLSDDDTIKGSSNFGRFLKYFSSEDSSWIDEINKKLEE